MNCKRIKNQLSAYIDNELHDVEYQIVTSHLELCSECKKEHDLLKLTWASLDVLPKVKPSHNYVSNFWATVSTRKTSIELAKERLTQMFFTWKIIPVYAALILAVSAFAVRNYFQFEESRKILAGLSEEEIEMVAQIELAENYEVIADIEFFEDLEVIESLDDLNVS